MEREIGERFDFKGEILEVVEAEGCEGCYFDLTGCSPFRNIIGFSSEIRRSDGKSVIFKKVDKTIVLLTKAHQEFIRCGIELEIVDEIEEYLNKTI